MSFVKDISVGVKVKRQGEELKKAKELCENARKEDAKLVKGIFKNLEAPGGDLEFTYRGHRGEPIRVYHLQDGETYEIPIGVAKHININTRVPVHQYLTDVDGRPITTPGSFRQRYQFLSPEYM